ncbi:hypothetical protein C0J52_27086 [Blattella germanica]|nr:hypothetical protein C0J52_27086 [Blattella germanica]
MQWAMFAPHARQSVSATKCITATTTRAGRWHCRYCSRLLTHQWRHPTIQTDYCNIHARGGSRTNDPFDTASKYTSIIQCVTLKARQRRCRNN